MTDRKTNNTSLRELVGRFEAIALRQDEAKEKLQYAKYGRLLKELASVRTELTSRTGGLLALLPLLKSPNEHMRYQAAYALVPVAYDRAREVLEQLAGDPLSPSCLDAGATLDRLDGLTLP